MWRCWVRDATNLVDFLDKGVSYRSSEAKDVVNYAFLKWRSPRVNRVKSANLDCQLKSALSDLRVFMQAPRTRELSEFLIILPQNQVHWLLADVGTLLNQQCLFNEEAEPTHNRFLAELGVGEHRCNELTGSLSRFFIKLNVPYSVNDFNTPFANPCVRISGLQHQCLEQRRQGI